MISIITITYNNLNGLKKTADSVQSQTYQDYEWIIIDGASTDGTLEFLETLDAIYISEPDNGIYDAMNKGLDRASGEYVIFMNAGDQFAHHDTLQNLQSDIQYHNEPDFIYGPALEVKSDRAPLQKSAIKIKQLPWGMITHHQAMLYKLSVISKIRYNLKYKIAADYEFTCHFLNQTQSAHMTQYELCLFEAGGISQQDVKTGRREQFQIRKELKICSAPLNYSIYALQSLTMFCRQKTPTLYWAFRSALKKAK